MLKRGRKIKDPAGRLNRDISASLWVRIDLDDIRILRKRAKESGVSSPAFVKNIIHEWALKNK